MKPKILLIEDDSVTIDLYENILKEAGFEVETLILGKEGLERLEEIKEDRKKKPDLVLLDLILPDINGMKILEEAKKEKETKDIPFLILTNFVSQEIKKMGERFGVEKYIVKTSVTPSELVKVIKRILKNGKNS